MNDFYMQSEIEARERQIRERQATPQADEGGPLLAPLARLITRPVRLIYGAARRTVPARQPNVSPIAQDGEAGNLP